jgi:hypothetical protein
MKNSYAMVTSEIKDVFFDELLSAVVTHRLYGVYKTNSFPAKLIGAGNSIKK